MSLPQSSTHDMIAAMAAELPVGFRDRGDGERMQAGLLLAYDAGDEVWELEYTALDPTRNFTLQDRSLGVVLGRAYERIGLRLARFPVKSASQGDTH